MNKTSITALMSAFGRAYHTGNAENPIFFDTKVRELMTEGDEAWNILHSQGRSSLSLDISSSVDVPGEWRINSKVSFKITVHLPDYGDYTSEYSILI